MNSVLQCIAYMGQPRFDGGARYAVAALTLLSLGLGDQRDPRKEFPMSGVPTLVLL